MLALVATLAARQGDYDPLRVPEARITSLTLEVKDTVRERVLPLRIYQPVAAKPAPVILFSHGLGGSRDANAYLGNHWAKRGYLAVFVQHPGSDEGLWKNWPQDERMAAMNRGASVTSFLERTKDIPAVIDALMLWNDEAGNPMSGRMDLKHLGMSGHSFGSVTTQALAGQAGPGGKARFLESRISAAVMMSPSIPAAGDPAAAFASIRMPCLLLTGTEDSSAFRNMGAEDRLKVFPNLRNAPAWQVVFDKAVHQSFGDRGQEGNRYHAAILALTTAFWDAELRGDRRAKAWLNGDGARSVLKPEDRWSVNALAKE